MRAKAVRQLAPGILISAASDEVVVVVQTDSATAVSCALDALPAAESGRGVKVVLALPGGERVPVDYRVDPSDLDRYPVVQVVATDC
jgi:hypothetical protein